MSKKFTGYLPTETQIADIAAKFKFTDKTELRYGINNAFWQLKIFNYARSTNRDPAALIRELNASSKNMQEILSRLSSPELSCMEDNFDGAFSHFIYQLTSNVSTLERLTNNSLINVPAAVIVAKKIPVWWFVWELAELWKSEIQEKPNCYYSTDNGYSGRFYRFVMQCASLDNERVFVTGAIIKDVLNKWHKENPMYERTSTIDK